MNEIEWDGFPVFRTSNPHHWLKMGDGKPICFQWNESIEKWNDDGVWRTPEYISKIGWEYVGVCPYPEENESRVQAAYLATKELCYGVADEQGSWGTAFETRTRILLAINDVKLDSNRIDALVEEERKKSHKLGFKAGFTAATKKLTKDVDVFGEYSMRPDITVGTKIRFKRESQFFTVQARSDRYLVCTKPYNPKRTVIYTVVDLKENMRGTDNLIFGLGYETRDDCWARLIDFQDGRVNLSRRNVVLLEIDEIKN